MKFKFSQIVALSAFLVAGCAAYYSVFGLSQLFAGASLAVIIMASSLEFSKIIAVSLLQRFWNKLSTGLRVYLCVGVFVLVCVTSAGIYGFLSNAYQKTASKFQISENEISVYTNKKSLFDKNISDNQTIINNKTKRLEQLSNLRTNQESRLDGAKDNSSRNRARTDIAAATLEIQNLNKDVDALNAKNAVLSDSANAYSTKGIEAKSKSTATSEIGPLKYLAEVSGYPMDKVVNWFILLLIFVFDPLAVALVIAFNRVIELEKEEANTENEVTNTENIVEDDLKTKLIKKWDESGYLDRVKLSKSGFPEFTIPIPEPIQKIDEPTIDLETYPSTPDAILTPSENYEKNMVALVEMDNDETKLMIEDPAEEHIIEGTNEEVLEPLVEEKEAETESVHLYEESDEHNEPIEEPVVEPESIVEPEPIVEIKEKPQEFEAVIPTGKVELEDIKEIKRGFSMPIPHSNLHNNLIQRVK